MSDRYTIEVLIGPCSAEQAELVLDQLVEADVPAAKGLGPAWAMRLWPEDEGEK